MKPNDSGGILLGDQPPEGEPISPLDRALGITIFPNEKGLTKKDYHKSLRQLAASILKKTAPSKARSCGRIAISN
jgi:hypothetical protein